MGASSENFCLRWNDFEASLTRSLCALRDEADLFDVAVATADGKTLLAHRLVLSACSDVFRRMLRQPANKISAAGPVNVFLRGITASEFAAVLNFMYHGEVNVAQDDLNSFLSVAEDLQVKGLSQTKEGSRSGRVRSVPTSAERPRATATKRTRADNNGDADAPEAKMATPMIPIKTEPAGIPVNIDNLNTGGVSDDHLHHHHVDDDDDDDDPDRTDFGDDFHSSYGFDDMDEGTSGTDRGDKDSKDAWWTAFEAPGQEFTEKGRRTERTYVFGDHAYLVDSRKGPNVYLRCRSYRPKATSPSCYGRAILNIDNRQVVVKREHMCGSTAEELENEKRRKNSVYIYLS